MPFLNHEMRSVEAATAPIEILYTAVCIISYIMRVCVNMCGKNASSIE